MTLIHNEHTTQLRLVSSMYTHTLSLSHSHTHTHILLLC